MRTQQDMLEDITRILTTTAGRVGHVGENVDSWSDDGQYRVYYDGNTSY